MLSGSASLTKGTFCVNTRVRCPQKERRWNRCWRRSHRRKAAFGGVFKSPAFGRHLLAPLNCEGGTIAGLRPSPSGAAIAKATQLPLQASTSETEEIATSVSEVAISFLNQFQKRLMQTCILCQLRMEGKADLDSAAHSDDALLHGTKHLNHRLVAAFVLHTE